MRLSARLLLLNADVATWRAARERRRRLQGDLACFATCAEQQDLLATLDRYPDGVTQELRDVLDRQIGRKGHRRVHNARRG